MLKAALLLTLFLHRKKAPEIVKRLEADLRAGRINEAYRDHVKRRLVELKRMS